MCDFAEYYQIYDYKALPVRYVATLAVGLRSDSRVKGELLEIEQPPVGITLVQVFDAIQNLAYAVAGGKEEPRSLLNAYMTGEKESNGYSTGAEFERAKKAILERVENGRTG